jgi:Spy/CpxP family protein refolding chaperone
MNQESRDLRTQKQTQQVWDIYKRQRKEEEKLRNNNEKEMKKLLRK